MTSLTFKKKFGWLASLALLGVVGMLASFGFIALSIFGITVPTIVAFIVFIVSGILSSICGLLMHREFTRRL